MSKKGSLKDMFHSYISFKNRIKNSYPYKLFSRIFSFICTIILILLIILGAMMFYFNHKAKQAEAQGVNYNAPIGLYTIISPSMEPNVSVYDTVVTVNVDDIKNIKVGDIITFISTWDINYGKTVTHRVISISTNNEGNIELMTKGDNNQQPDGAVVTQNNIIGKVVMKFPQLGKVQFFLATKMGWFVAVFIPAIIVIIIDIIKLFKLLILKPEEHNRNINQIGTTDNNVIAPVPQSINEQPINVESVVVPDAKVVNEVNTNSVPNVIENTVQNVVEPIIVAEEKSIEPNVTQVAAPIIPTVVVNNNEQVIIPNNQVESNITEVKKLSRPVDNQVPIIKPLNTHRPLERRNKKEVTVENEVKVDIPTVSENQIILPDGIPVQPVKKEDYIGEVKTISSSFEEVVPNKLEETIELPMLIDEGNEKVLEKRKHL